MTDDITAPSPYLVGCAYSIPGMSKTTDALATFPRALCIGVRSAIATPAENVLGFTPAVWPLFPQADGTFVNITESCPHLPAQVDDLDRLITVLKWLSSPEGEGWAQYFGAVYVDDQTLIDRTWIMRSKAAAADPRDPRFKTRAGNVDTLGIYGTLGDHKTFIANVSRWMKCHFWCSAHEIERGSRVNHDGSATKWPMGPDFGSKSQITKVPAWFDQCMRSLTCEDSLDPWIQRAYYVDIDNMHNVMSKSRAYACWDKTPARLRAILHESATPYKLQRVPGLEWQDEDMELVSAAVVSSGGDREAIMEVVKDVFQRRTGSDFVPMQMSTDAQRHARWAVQDGIALGTIRLRATTLSAFDGYAGGGGATTASAPAGPPM